MEVGKMRNTKKKMVVKYDIRQKGLLGTKCTTKLYTGLHRHKSIPHTSGIKMK